MPAFLNASDTPLDKTSRTDLDDSTCADSIWKKLRPKIFNFEIRITWHIKQFLQLDMRKWWICCETFKKFMCVFESCGAFCFNLGNS
jgi:hypothetical protein